MAMTVSELQVKVSADTREAESGLASLGSKVGSVGGSIATAFGGAAIAGIAGLTAGLAASVSAAAGFESQMSAVKAVSGATAGEMEQLSSLALQLGADTSFSASEAAAGIGELIKAGVSIGDVMGGAASASLSLAAAGAISVGDAAEIAANAMNQFGLKGTDLAHVSDLIAGAANASAIDVNDFKFSLAAVGAVANTVGFSFDDTAAAIALLGQAGIKGSDAGTSLKTMLLNLQPSTEKQTALFRELGLITADGANQFFDASGKVKSMSEVAGTLQTALAGMTQQQKLATLETIFGSDAIRAAAVFANQGAAGFDAMAASMGKVTADEVAKERLNNLKGSLEQLGGSLETVGIKIGMQFTPVLKEMADGATTAVNQAGPSLEAFATGAVENLRAAGVRLGDSWRTVQQVFAGDWSPSDKIDPFINSVGIAATKVKEFRDVIVEAAAKAEAMGAWENVKTGFSNLADAAGLASDRLDDISAALGRAHGPSGQAASKADVLASALKGAALGFEYVSLKVGDFVDTIGTAIAVAIDFVTAMARTGDALTKLKSGDLPGAVAALGEAKEAFGAGMTAAEDFRQRGLISTGAEARIFSDLMNIHMTATKATVETNMSAANAAVGTNSAGMQQFLETNLGAGQTAAETAMAGVASSTETHMAAADASASTHAGAVSTTVTTDFGAAQTAATAATTAIASATATDMASMSGSVSRESGAAASSFSGSMNTMSSSTSGPKGAIDSLLGAAQSLWNWLSGHTFRFNIELPHLPSWAIPGSPTPLEMGFRGIADSLHDLNRISVPTLGMAPSRAPLAASAAPSGAASPFQSHRIEIAIGGRVAEEIYVTGRDLAIRRGRVSAGSA